MDANILIIDAHAHLWLDQQAVVNGQTIESQAGGRAHFMGETRQMLPPYLLDGQNTAAVLLSNMDYAQVAAACITQEYIDGCQDNYLLSVQQQHPNRFRCCALIDARKPGYFERAKEQLKQGFTAFKIPAGRLIMPHERVSLTCPEMLKLFELMETNHILLSIDLADGAIQVPEMEEVIASFPSLKIAIGHFGMVTRADWQAQIKLARHPHVRIESGGITWLFHQEFYPFTGAVWAIKEAASLVGIEKLLWGSDYPRTMAAITYKMSYDFILKSNLLTLTEKQLFLGENAKSFYGFDHATPLPFIKNMCE